MRVLKFGGTSVANAERINRLLSIIRKQYLDKGEKPVLVVSALSGVTNLLVNMATLASEGNPNYLGSLAEFKERHYTCLDNLLSNPDNDCVEYLNKSFSDLEGLLLSLSMLRELSKRSLDLILSFGELISARIISSYFTATGIESDFIDARKWIKTDSTFGQASVDFILTSENINEHFQKSTKIAIITGFLASNKEGITTTLGRGGSDYTASIVGSAIEAKSVDIWTDVNGVLTSDPRLVEKAFTIEQMSYEEAMEMSHFGASVIYPPTIKPLMDKNIPVLIKNTFEPEHPGTIIKATTMTSGSNNPVKGVSALGNSAILRLQGAGLQGVPGIASRFFGCLAHAGINIFMITQASSEQSICVSIAEADLDHAITTIGAEFEAEINKKIVDPLAVDENVSIIAVVGDEMRNQPGVSGKLFSVLGQNGVNVEAIAQGSSERNISFAVKSSFKKKALNVVHDAFFVSRAKTVHLYVVGLGLIGKTLLRQINENKSTLANKGIEIKVMGLANSRKMVLSSYELNLDGWEAKLESGFESDTAAFVSQMIDMNLHNSIFVDCTASVSLPVFYGQILSSSISISTPNKMAASSSYENLMVLKALAKKHLVHFLYETNVGAALPIVSTIRNLVESGDRVIGIDAVLSGSLSYIFNSFSSGGSFSELVEEARNKGFTEPDPRDDLNGMDVKRKLTILIREAGFPIEVKDVVFDSILPEGLLKEKSVSAFLSTLKQYDDHYQDLVKKAEDQNCRLRLIAKYYNGKAVLKLESVAQDNPFYGLSGSENMVALRTDRYDSSPLIVRGPGAGAEVTASGVFSEILEISRRK